MPGDQACASCFLLGRSEGTPCCEGKLSWGRAQSQAFFPAARCLPSSLLICPQPLQPLPMSPPPRGPQILSCPGPTLLIPSFLHRSLQLPQQGLPPSLADLIQHITDKLQSLSLNPLSPPKPGRFPLNGTTHLIPAFCLLSVCLANSLSWQVQQEAITLLKPGA